jgi:hypothetical protein
VKGDQCESITNHRYHSFRPVVLRVAGQLGERFLQSGIDPHSINTGGDYLGGLVDSSSGALTLGDRSIIAHER